MRWNACISLMKELTILLLLVKLFYGCFAQRFIILISCSNISHFIETSYLTFTAIQLTGCYVMRDLGVGILETGYKQFYMCLYVCVYICAYINVSVSVDICYMYVCMYIYIYIYICMYIYIYMCIWICVYVYTCAYVYVYIYMYVCINIYILLLTFKLLLCSSFAGIFSVCLSLDNVYQF